MLPNHRNWAAIIKRETDGLLCTSYGAASGAGGALANPVFDQLRTIEHSLKRGVKGSRHQAELEADVSIPDATPEEVVRAMRNVEVVEAS